MARRTRDSIAQEAEVDLLLSGTIVCGDDELRINAELVQAPTDTLLASYVCQIRRDNMFEVQDSLVRRIVEVLMLRLTERERRTLSHDVPASARAYEFYLRANHVQRERKMENIVMARDLYRECVEDDPNYAAAWARLGRCYRFLEKFGEERPESLELAQWAFHRAFALNPDLAIAHNLYTQIEADLGNAQAAMVRLLERAQTHPNDPELFAGLVQACRFCGLLDESIAAHHRARRLDSKASPVWPILLLERGVRTGAGIVRGDIRRLPSGCGDPDAYRSRGGCRRTAGAAPFLRCARRWMRTLIDSLRALLEGEQAKSAELVRRALAEPVRDPECKFYLARHLARSGAHREALDTIRELIADGFFCSTALLRDPWLQPLAVLPDFQDRDAVLQREAEARAAYAAASGDRALA